MPSSDLIIGAFNCQAFSRRKLHDPAVQRHILRILSHYDLVLVQEVRDNSGAMVSDLLALLAGEDPQALAAAAHIGKKKPSGGPSNSDPSNSGNKKAAVAEGGAALPKGKAKRKPNKTAAPATHDDASANEDEYDVDDDFIDDAKGSTDRAAPVSPSRLKYLPTWMRFNSNKHAEKYPRARPQSNGSGMRSLAADKLSALESAVKKRVQKQWPSGITNTPWVGGDGLIGPDKSDAATVVNADDGDFVPEHYVPEGAPYHALLSPPLGAAAANGEAGRHQERYVYLYRPEKLQPRATYLHPDDKFGDQFAREPMAVKFSIVSSGVELAVVGLHTKPTMAVAEINEAEKVMRYLRTIWSPQATLGGGIGYGGTDDQGAAGHAVQPPVASPGLKWRRRIRRWFPIFGCCIDIAHPEDANHAVVESSAPSPSAMQRLLARNPAAGGRPPPPMIGPILIGDLNAGKNYVPLRARASMPLFTSSDYVWGIAHGTDTTVRGGNDFTYDRAIWWQADSAWVTAGGSKGDGVWRWQHDLGIETEEECLKVSDHWAVEVRVAV